MIFFLILFNLVFVYFFYHIGFWYLWAIPLIFVLFFLFNFTDFLKNQGENSTENIKKALLKNFFVISWFMILIWAFWLLTEFQLISEYDYVSAYFLIVANILLWYLSYFIKYKDGTLFFHLWYYFSWGIFFYQIYPLLSFSSFFDVILLFIVKTFALYVFLIFIIWTFIENKLYNIKQIAFLYFILTAMVFIYSNISDTPYISLVISQFLLTLIFLFIYLLNVFQQRYKEKVTSKSKLEYILEGWTIASKKEKRKFSKILEDVSGFFNSVPEYIKFLLALLNLWLIFGQIYIFFMNIGSDEFLYYEMFYWFSILMFFINFVLMKLINYYYSLQRIFSFFILNFWIYLTIINIFGENYFYIVLFWIGWNLFNSLIIFVSKRLFLSEILKKEDFYLWIFANFLAVLVNIYFIYLLDIALDTSIYIITMYIWMWFFVTFYNIKYIEKNLK